MTRYSNYEVSILKPTQGQIDRLSSVCRLRQWKYWCGTSVGMKKMNISGQCYTEAKANATVHDILDIMNYSYPLMHNKVRVSIKSYWSWEEKCIKLLK